MKRTLKFAIVALIISLSNNIFAQESRFIEVLVSDTINLKALSYTYMISIEPTYNYDEEEGKAEAPKSATLNDVEALLKKENINFEYSKSSDLTISTKNMASPSIIVTMKTRAELEKLYNLINPLKGVSGSIAYASYETSDLYNTQMFRKLYTKAQTQANEMAKVSGSEIKRMSNAIEVKDQMDGYMDFFKQIFRKMPKGAGLGFDTFTENVYTKRMQFRFELK